MAAFEAILFTVLALITVIEIVFTIAILLEKHWRVTNQIAVTVASKDPRWSVRAVDFWFGDLFFQRLFMLGINFAHTITTIGARTNSNVSLAECKGWNASTVILLAMGKYAAYLFLFGKQRVLKEQLSEKIKLNEKVLFALIQLMPILGSLIALLRDYKMSSTGECLIISNGSSLPLIGLSFLLEMINVFWLLRLFLRVIHENLNTSVDSHPDTPKNSSANNSASAETRKIMYLNKRSCVISVVAFLFLIVFGVAMMNEKDRDLAEFVNALARAGDLFADCLAMMLCSPKIWNTFKKIVLNKSKFSTANKGGAGGNNDVESARQSTEAKDLQRAPSGSSAANSEIPLKDPVEAMSNVGKSV